MIALVLAALAHADPAAADTEDGAGGTGGQPTIGTLPPELLKVAESVASRPLPERMGAISGQLLRRPYVSDPMGEGVLPDADPFARYDVFDCLTFTEEVMALAMAGDPAHASEIRDLLRYEPGGRDYAHRRHFMELQWVPGTIGAGLLRDTTREYGPTVALDKDVTPSTWKGWSGRKKFAHTDEQLPLGHMHLDVRSDRPGRCPICGMDLTPVTAEEAESGGVQIDAARRQEFAIRFAEARRVPLAVEIRAPGRIAFAESAEQDVVSRVSGTIVELVVDRTGARVGAGQVLVRLHSPELETAQREHVLVVASGDAAVVAASRTRLRRLGLLEAQVDAIESGRQPPEVVELRAPAAGVVVSKDVVEGAGVMPGTRLCRLARLDRVWVEADVYDRDAHQVTVGMPATVRTGSDALEGRVDLVYPEADPLTRTRVARITVSGAGPDLLPGGLVDVVLRDELGERLVVPDTAVLYTGPRRIVFVDRGAAGLVPVEVTVGARGDGVLEITSGLEEGDRVVSSGTFLVAAESRIRSASDLWEATDDEP